MALRCRIRFNPERHACGVFKGWWHRRHSIQFFATRTATVTSCTCTGMVASGTGTTTGSTTIMVSVIRLLVSQISSFLSSQYSFLVGEFCFVSCPFHPPSILPASSNFTERAMYFLSSKDFVSQSTKRSTRRVSAFLIARRTYGCFSPGERKLAADIASIISTNKVSIR